MYSFVLGFLLAFDNVPVLYGITGLYLASPALVFIILGVWLMRKHALKNPRMRSYSFACYLLLVWSIVSITIPTLWGSEANLNLAKAITTLTIVFTWLAAAWFGVLVDEAPRLLRAIGAGLLLASILGLAVQLTSILPSGSTDLVHAISWHADRPRGFKYESSSFGASILAAFALLSVGAKPKAGFALLPAALALVFISSSRGAIAALVLGCLIGGVFYVLSSSHAGRWVAVISFAITSIFLSFFGSVLVRGDIWAVLRTGTGGSDGIRTGWGLVAWRVLSDGPFSLNVATYWDRISYYIAQAIPEISQQYSRVQISEFYAFLNTTSDSGLSPKTVPALFAVWFGWAGVIFAVVLLSSSVMGFMYLSRRTSSYTVMALGSSCIISLVMFVPGIFQYELAIVVGIGIAGSLGVRKMQEPVNRTEASIT
ncbi:MULTISPECIES: hypothetical protein [Nocardiaceae]|uniref:O-antigen ligase domain-containing protein n=1 Tax=Rhodococcoides corynebacterioides TaxID=53972 RepID=A0ABS2KZL9_9NOCA|nr:MULTISPECIES: hypothetical protein [Rhodococcus]MBM7417246.1 hypothetical protein [Rhodococcus corynebacterioides]MBP1115499.1 hypothetical protein [Rhodococcus sp. PvP016]